MNTKPIKTSSTVVEVEYNSENPINPVLEIKMPCECRSIITCNPFEGDGKVFLFKIPAYFLKAQEYEIILTTGPWCCRYGEPGTLIVEG